MKKITILLFTAIMVAGAVFAQPVRDQRREAAPADRNEQREFNPQRHNRPDALPRPQRDLNTERFSEAALVTVNGTLKLERGIVAIQGQDDTVYLVPMLNRFIGFLGGLREGANISVEGYQIRNIINPAKATIDGQTYDFRRLVQNNMNLNSDRRDNPWQNRNNHSHKHGKYNRR